jgi:hypothetical protein
MLYDEASWIRDGVDGVTMALDTSPKVANGSKL